MYLTVTLIFSFASLLFFIGAAQGYNHNAKIASGAFSIATGVGPSRVVSKRKLTIGPIQVVGLYTGLATMIKGGLGKELLPLGRVGKAAEAE